MQATRQRLQQLHNRHTEATNNTQETAAVYEATLKYDQKWSDGLIAFLAYCLSRLDGY